MAAYAIGAVPSPELIVATWGNGQPLLPAHASSLYDLNRLIAELGSLKLTRLPADPTPRKLGCVNTPIRMRRSSGFHACRWSRRINRGKGPLEGLYCPHQFVAGIGLRR